MKTLAILQNMWFKDPEKMKLQLAGPFKGNRERFIRTWLFWSCLTGKRLTNAFGEEVCDQIIWEEASPEIGGKSSSAFPPDPAHIFGAIRLHQPAIVITFGKIAAEGFAQTRFLHGSKPEFTAFRYLSAPHPAARHGTVVAELAEIARQHAEMCAAATVVNA